MSDCLLILTSLSIELFCLCSPSTWTVRELVKDPGRTSEATSLLSFRGSSQRVFSTLQDKSHNSAVKFEWFHGRFTRKHRFLNVPIDSEFRFHFGGGVAPASKPLATNEKPPWRHLPSPSSISYLQLNLSSRQAHLSERVQLVF